jgi:TRAP-type mannitol/chloroaromatic compound transport system permease small subunit
VAVASPASLRAVVRGNQPAGASSRAAGGNVAESTRPQPGARKDALDILLRVSSGIDAFSERIGKIVMWLVLISSLVSAGNAIVRKLLNTSSNAWLEIQWYMFAAMFLLAAGYTLKYDEHVRVDLFYHRYSKRLQAWLDLLGGIFFLMPMAVIIGWLSLPMVINSYNIHEMSADAGGLLRWPVKIIIPIGFALLVIQGLSEIIKRIGYLTGRSELAHTYQAPLQ